MKFCLAVGKTTSPTTPLLLEGDFVESMRRARAMGYDAVEIHTPEPDQLDVERLRRACGALERTSRLSRRAPKRRAHHLRQSGIDQDSTGGGESIAAKQSRTFP